MAKQSKSYVTVRLTAANWDVTIPEVGTFNLRKMDRNERGKFHGLFMASVRKTFRNRKVA